MKICPKCNQEMPDGPCWTVEIKQAGKKELFDATIQKKDGTIVSALKGFRRHGLRFSKWYDRVAGDGQVSLHFHWN